MSIFEKRDKKRKAKFKYCNCYVLLTFEENLGRENLDGVVSIAQVLNCCVVKHLRVGVFLKDGLLAAQELLLGVFLQICGHHGGR